MARFYTVLLLVFCFSGLQAQLEVRTVDGAGNNPHHAEWGMVGSYLHNHAPSGFADGQSAPSGEGRPNPRTISNALFGQEGNMFSERNLNDLWWAFGQFTDHDITLTFDSDQEFAGIRVPAGDVDFDPNGDGGAMIPMMRSHGELDATGLRRYRNEITTFIDGSNIYGSSRERMDYLRSFEGGRMRTSSGRLPIFNTLTGEYGAPVDEDAPHMDGAQHKGQRLLVAGDARANENSLLAAMHTIWLREHNRIADSLVQEFPSRSDEAIFQHARLLVEAQLQWITYHEWLPAIGVELGHSSGYDNTVNPAITNEFSVAAFRFGHTLVGSDLWLMDRFGQTLPNSPLSLREVFFNPISVIQRDGIDALLMGASAHRQQQLDCSVVEDLRSFLFGQPGAGGLDLAAININRGRERGLPSFNTIRESYDLEPILSFYDLTSDEELIGKLNELYDSVDDIDPWVAMLAEWGEDGLGQTIRVMLGEQFGRLRTGDRLYHEHSGNFSPSELAWVREQSLLEVISRNTQLELDGESFDATGIPSTTIAQTSLLDPQIEVVNKQVQLTGLESYEQVDIHVTDVLGRTLTVEKGLQADGFGDGTLTLTIQVPQLAIITLYRQSGKQSSVQTLIR